MKTIQQTVLKSGRRYFTAAILIFLMPAYLHAEIYKCENTQSGVIEYKEKPCNESQSTQEIEDKPKQSSNNRRSGEFIYKDQLVRDLSDTITDLCISRFSKRGLSKAQSEQTCNTALEKFAFCVVDAQKLVFPRKANDVFFSELEKGKSEEEARQETKKRKHWGNFTQDQRIKTMFLLQGMMEMCKEEFKKKIL